MAWLALHIAVLPHQKTLPTIDELVGATETPHRPRVQTAAQIQENMRWWGIAQAMALADRQRPAG